MSIGRPIIDIAGQRYGRLVAIQEQYRIGSRSYWLCRCDCGNEVIAEKHDMRLGCTRSCGCLRREMLAQRNKAKRNELPDTTRRDRPVARR